MSVSAVSSLFLASLLAADARLPRDPALDAVRPRLEQSLSAADAAHLPADLLVSKIREGVAKRVPPQAIVVAVDAVAERLITARTWLKDAGNREPSHRLLQAVAEAQLVGLGSRDLRPLLQPPAGEEAKVEAVEVLTDLSLRGYDGAHAVPIVERLLAHDARALPQLAGALETIRRDFALTATEAAQAVDSGLQTEGHLAAATAQARQRAERAQPSKGGGKADKMQDGRDRGVQAHPGRGMGKGLGKMK